LRSSARFEAAPPEAELPLKAELHPPVVFLEARALSVADHRALAAFPVEVAAVVVLEGDAAAHPLT
jgi:hypothetical protein